MRLCDFLSPDQRQFVLKAAKNSLASAKGQTRTTRISPDARKKAWAKKPACERLISQFSR